MGGHRAHRAAAVTVLAAAVLAGCSDGGDGGGGTPTDSASAAVSRAASAASSLASEGSDALASATAEAGRWLEDITSGADVKAGAPGTDSGGRTTAEITVRNTAKDTKSFAVQVNFTDAGNTLLDTVVVTVDDVPAGRSGSATARSSHDLSGDVRAVVARAVRY
ncbi:hypothetical protein [Streptomyces sp. NPDC003719]